MLPNRCDADDYKPGMVVPFPTRPWPTPQSPPCYFPQRYESTAIQEAEMGRIGGWASGHVDWTPLAGMTGTRPTVDKYSLTKYSTDEWRKRNAIILDGEPIRQADTLEIDVKNCMNQAYTVADQEYSSNTGLLKNRAHEIYRWKSETEYCIRAMADEINSLEEIRQRLKAAMAIMAVPDSIAKECIDLRLNRLEPDLVRDMAEEELIKEISLIAEIKRLYDITLSDVETQQKNNKAGKARVEFDWSDKVISYDTDSVNIAVNKQSITALIKPGSVRIPQEQSTLCYWEEFCKNNLEEAETSRQRSISLRKFIESMLLRTARDLRTQAERVDQALAEKATCTSELKIRLEDELKITLQKLTNVEILSEELKTAMRNMDLSMKVAHTRLDNRSVYGRPNVENCRDGPQCGLNDEVKSLSERIHTLREKLQDANEVRVELLKSRGILEREIMIKKRSISIDADRCKIARSFYPSASKLSGHE